MRRVSRKPKTTAAARRRPRAKPLFDRARVRVGVAVLAAAAVGIGAWQVWQAGWIQEGGERARARLIEASAAMGFTVQQITVEGRSETPPEDLRDALGLERGAPILGFDPRAAHARLKKLPWIRSASVERLLPDTVALRIVERRPIALWQKDGVFSLIDAEGAVIPIDDIARFNRLVVVVGAEAPIHAAGLMNLLETEPGLAARVRAAVRIGDRRWNVHLDDGMRILLPEQAPAAAWRKLAEIERGSGLLARNYSVIDLRLKDRIVVRQAPGEDDAAERAQRNT